MNCVDEKGSLAGRRMLIKFDFVRLMLHKAVMM